MFSQESPIQDYLLVSRSLSSRDIAGWKKSFFPDILALRDNFGTIRKIPPFLWKQGVFDQLTYI